LRSLPVLYQRIYDKVRPLRLQMKDKARRERWWLFGRSNQEIREAIAGMTRFVATCRTAKHRAFVFLEGDILPDAKLIAIGLDDGFSLGVLSSMPHLVWALRTGAFLEDRPNYNHSDCFGTFPFPDCSNKLRTLIDRLGEAIDAHRKRQQRMHPDLTITRMYNVLEKLRSGEPLTAREKTIHEQGLVSVLKQIHDELDAAVFDAYGWPHDLEDEEILQRLVDLNHERAEEESRGIIRWLRPEFQNPAHGQAPPQDTQGDLELEIEIDDEDEDAKPTKKTTATKVAKLPWPKTLPERMVAIQSALQRHGGPADSKQIASSFTRANKADVALLLETLTAVGIVRQLEDGRFAAYK